MKRIDLIFSAAIEEDVFAGFKKYEIGKKYTKIPCVMGEGCSNPKLGDAIWPQLNTFIMVYCEEEEAEKIYNFVKELREQYPVEGLACFSSDAELH